MHRPVATRAKGFRDYFGAQATARYTLLHTIRALYELYGFEALETPAVETVEALGQFLPDVDRPNAGVFAFQEQTLAGEAGDWLALRYDLTAPLARVAAEYRADLPRPYRRYAFGTVWRNEKPGPGRYRQFYQADADTIGSSAAAADAEMCAVLADVFQAVGLATQDYRICLNNRKVLSSVLAAAHVEPDSHAYGIALRAIDKLDRLGTDGVAALLSDGRRDASGDFTQGAHLTAAQIDRVMAFLAVPAGGGETLDALANVVADSPSGSKGVEELAAIYAGLSGHTAARVCIIDPSVVRGLAYYTGSVFETVLSNPNLTEFGSIAGGGRYDDLVHRFTGEHVPAVGISIGIDRLLLVLAKQADIKGHISAHTGPVVVTIMDADHIQDYQSIVYELRAHGIATELYLGNPKHALARQLKYADKRAAPLAILVGSDERAHGQAVIKDLVAGEHIAPHADLATWKSHPTQTTVPRSELCRVVANMLHSATKPNV